MKRDAEFCPECGVAVDLHPERVDEGDTDACDVARLKASAIVQFWMLAEIGR